MKLIGFALLLFLCPAISFSQDYMTTIAEKSCQCLDKIQSSENKNEFTMQLGLCMLEAATPYQKEIERDHNINFENIDKEGEKLGRIIGMKMATVCPNTLVKISQQADDEDKNKEVTSEGTVMKIDSDLFVVFSIKDDAGKVNKYYWLSFVESETDLINSYLSLVKKKVSFGYTTQEFFDPRIKEYRQVFVLTEIQESR
jgi:hypothetical protein